MGGRVGVGSSDRRLLQQVRAGGGSGHMETVGSGESGWIWACFEGRMNSIS